MKKEIIKEYIKINIEGWNEDLENNFSKSLFKSIAHWNIILLIAENSYFEKNYSFESLCRLVKSSVASRATIQRIINELIDLQIIEKRIKNNDQRVKCFYLTKSGNQLFDSYVENEIATFKSIRDIL